MPKVFCGKPCRDAWTLADQKSKRKAAKEEGEAPVDKPAWSPARELANRRAEIDRTPSLRAALERCRRGAIHPITVAERLRQIELDRRRMGSEA
jgi:hypothetical protein